MGDLRYLDADGRRKNPATRRFTEPPDPPPEKLYTSDHSRFPRLHQGEGSRFHNGDFSAQFNGGGVYGDDLRLGIEGYIRHDPRWGSVGCETRRILDVIEPLMGTDFRVVYTDGFVEYPGAKAISWHSGARAAKPCRIIATKGDHLLVLCHVLVIWLTVCYRWPAPGVRWAGDRRIAPDHEPLDAL